MLVAKKWTIDIQQKCHLPYYSVSDNPIDGKSINSARPLWLTESRVIAPTTGRPVAAQTGVIAISKRLPSLYARLTHDQFIFNFLRIL